MPDGTEYWGNDLFQNKDDGVAYIGDVLSMDFGRTFSCVMALDIVEHVDDPYSLMDKLVSLTDKYLIVSLPNIYDIQHKYNFVMKSTLGRKYHFGVENKLDRHRWVMSYDEIHQFYKAFAKKYSLSLETIDISIEETPTRVNTALILKVFSPFLSRKVMTTTVFAVFSKA
jgi:hypothetical protein